jgi:aspartate aminotransferase
METITLASGAAYFNTPEPIRRAAALALEAGQTSYGPTEGTAEMRQAVADRYQRLNGTTVSPDRVLITAGVKQALYSIFLHLLQPGDEVIIQTPNWFGFHELLLQAKVNLIFLPTNPATEYTLLPDVLEAAITPRTKMVILSNPCNPTGRIYSKAEISSLLAVIHQHPKVWVLSDEIYDLVTYGTRVPSLLEFPDVHQRYIVVNGFAKSFAMSGWRVGYLLAPNEVYQACSKFQATAIGGVSPFVQAGAAAALQQAENLLASMNQVLAQNCTFMAEQLQVISQIPFYMPQAAYYIFADLSYYINRLTQAGQGSGTDTGLADYLRQKAGIEIYPGTYFGGPGFARLSFALEPNQLQTALHRLQKALHALL